MLSISLNATTEKKLELDPELFPGIESYAKETLVLKGLSALYPGRVIFEAPTAFESQRNQPAKVENLEKDIVYIRVYDLEGAIPSIEANASVPALVIDLRYVASEASGTHFASLFYDNQLQERLLTVGDVPQSVREEMNQGFTAKNTRQHPAIVLVNRDTAGPFEAYLHDLQAQDRIIAVGEATAGATGFHQQFGEKTWIISGELRPSSGHSLIGSGFKPRIEMQTNAKQNYVSYHLYEAGTPIESLIADEPHSSNNEKDKQTEKDSDALLGSDSFLKRSMEIVEALQILGRIPKSTSNE